MILTFAFFFSVIFFLDLDKAIIIGQYMTYCRICYSVHGYHYVTPSKQYEIGISSWSKFLSNKSKVSSNIAFKLWMIHGTDVE